MCRWMLILATISVAAVILAFAPDADAGGYGNQVFVNQFGQVVQVQSGFHGHVFAQPQVVIQNGYGFQRQVFRPQVQVNVNRGFRGYGFGPRRGFFFRF